MINIIIIAFRSLAIILMISAFKANSSPIAWRKYLPPNCAQAASDLYLRWASKNERGNSLAEITNFIIDQSLVGMITNYAYSKCAEELKQDSINGPQDLRPSSDDTKDTLGSEYGAAVKAFFVAALPTTPVGYVVPAMKTCTRYAAAGCDLLIGAVEKGADFLQGAAQKGLGYLANWLSGENNDLKPTSPSPQEIFESAKNDAISQALSEKSGFRLQES